MNRLFLLLTSLALVIVSGCVKSVHPLSAKEKAKADPLLIGRWRFQQKAGTKPPESIPNLPKALEVSFDDKGCGQTTFLLQDGTRQPAFGDWFITRTTKTTFINLPDPATEENPLYMLYKYRVADDHKSVHLWSLRPEAFKNAVESGLLKGSFQVEKPSGHGPAAGGYHVYLDETGERLLNFLEMYPEEKIFEDFAVLERVE